MTFQSEDFIPTRYSLLSRLKNWDDQDSWKVFFDTYWRLIYSVALKSGLTEAEAQDVVQETIISVAKSIHKFKPNRELGSFKGWLRNLTRWRIADQLRKRTHVEPANQEEATGAFHEQDMANIPESKEPDSVWENEWRLNLLKVALDNVRSRVKEEHFQIFDLYVVRQWPVAKVMRTLGVSAGQVYLVKFRVGAMVKKEVRRLENSEVSIE